jgi:parvulin-like peptidyl-prolyl isomerase
MTPDLHPPAPRQPTALHPRSLVIGLIAGLGAACLLAAAPRPDPKVPITAPSANAPAFIDGTPTPWSELTPLLAEASGGTILLELTLDRRLQQRLAKAGLTLTPAAVEAERAELTRQMTAASDPDTAARTLARIRSQRGLGDLRFEALIRRSAMLRALVAPAIELQTHAALFGPRVSIRIITVSTEQDASKLSEELRNLPPDKRELAFSEAALSRSTDESASSGGILPPFAEADPSMPSAVRRTVAGLSVGDVSRVIPLDSGFAVVLLRSRTAGDGSTLDSRREAVTRAARARQERLAMDKLARLIASEPGVTIPDAGLRWSSEAAGTGLRP